ncbi:MAG: hypothetical protein GY904_26220 [Planctomycetaceae bacterium]|nr:hypothetical protein [Planctomycetaceae bacterium]
MPIQILELWTIDPLISAVARLVVSSIVGWSADRGIAEGAGECWLSDSLHSEALVSEVLGQQKKRGL